MRSYFCDGVAPRRREKKTINLSTFYLVSGSQVPRLQNVSNLNRASRHFQPPPRSNKQNTNKCVSEFFPFEMWKKKGGSVRTWNGSEHFKVLKSVGATLQASTWRCPVFTPSEPDQRGHPSAGLNMTVTLDNRYPGSCFLFRFGPGSILFFFSLLSRCHVSVTPRAFLSVRFCQQPPNMLFI